ncbi:MAG TPA: hypothetical protein VLA89_15030, partial [Gemmatimonadales bacterium]|nr:hypothetical protein [Gemmatimonadales bacterium]
ELSGRNIEREIIDGRESVEAFGEVLELEDGRDGAARGWSLWGVGGGWWRAQVWIIAPPPTTHHPPPTTDFGL